MKRFRILKYFLSFGFLLSIFSHVYAADGVAQLQIVTQAPIASIMVSGANQNGDPVTAEWAFAEEEDVTVFTTWDYWWRIRYFCGLFDCWFDEYPEDVEPYVWIRYFDGHLEHQRCPSSDSPGDPHFISDLANVHQCVFSYSSSGTGDDPDGDDPDGDDPDGNPVPEPPVALFNMVGDPEATGLTVSFINQTSGVDNTTSYRWFFGDGNTSTDVNPSHTYGGFGVYTVTLTATNTGGSSQHQMTITAGCVAPTGLNVCILQDGDILLISRQGFTNNTAGLVAGTYWYHSGIYDSSNVVYEAVGLRNNDDDEITNTPIQLTSFYTNSDAEIVVLRLVSLENRSELINDAMSRAEQIATDNTYVYTLQYTAQDLKDQNRTRLYCTLFTWNAYFFGNQSIDFDYAIDGMSWNAFHNNGVLGDELMNSSVGTNASTYVAQRTDTNLNNNAVVALYSPADLLVIDPQGNQTGYLSSTNSSITEITNSFYSGPSEEPEWATIRNLEAESRIIITGTGEGDYDIELRLLNSEITSDVFTWDTVPGQVDIYEYAEDVSGTNLQPVALTVPIDVRPYNSERNLIDPNSNSEFQLAILSRPHFDATRVDPATVFVSGAPVAQTENSDSCTRYKTHERDVNGDGLMDFIVQIDVSQLNVSVETSALEFEGSTIDGLPLVGSDIIEIVPQEGSILDSDHDGFINSEDACPWQGDEGGLGVDETGCPYYDADWDGIYNRDDACPWRGDESCLGIDNTGCPYYDADSDGVIDREDACPWQGDEGGGDLSIDETGCPSYDADDDGVIDSEDACPWRGNEYGLGIDETGCPIEEGSFSTDEPHPINTEEWIEPDTDGDGFANISDACPWHGNEDGLGVDETGCPYYDADWDGVLDRNDECVWRGNEYGLGVDATGCPIEPDDPYVTEDPNATEEPITTEEPQ